MELVTLIVGILIGMIIMLLIVWLVYATRSFVFVSCPSGVPPCTAADYYNNPGNALANGAKVDDILFINSDNEMFYKRVPKNNNCAPLSNATVHVRYPQYCSFNGVVGKALSYNSPDYQVGGNTVRTTGDCHISGGHGVPILRWDATS